MKTELIKEGTIGKLQAQLTKERKYVRLAEQAETKRMEAVKEWFTAKKLPLDDMSTTKMLINLDNDKDVQDLEQITVELAEIIIKLKQQEQLNQDLINQSMQFVQLSLNMLNPSIQNMNYGKNNSKQTAKLSVFDSKA